MDSDPQSSSKESKQIRFKRGVKLGPVTKTKGEDWSKHPDPSFRKAANSPRKSGGST